MSRYPHRPPIVTHRPRGSRFATAPRTAEYNTAVWDGIKRFAPDKIPALLNTAHDEALILNRAWDVQENKETR
jgi:hypothetical protein